MRQHTIPKFVNTRWHKLHMFGYGGYATQKFLRLYREQLWNKKRRARVFVTIFYHLLNAYTSYIYLNLFIFVFVKKIKITLFQSWHKSCCNINKEIPESGSWSCERTVSKCWYRSDKSLEESKRSYCTYVGAIPVNRVANYWTFVKCYICECKISDRSNTIHKFIYI